MKRRLMDLLACPIDKYYPLELYVFEEKVGIVEGMIVCPK
ncbi:Trm112 family protein, partial [Candidatus Bathyarchaeota archaeon]